LGVPIKGHVTAARAGHASNVEFVKKLKKQYTKELNELWAEPVGE
jgi:UDP-3-O-[3-hydroxymyristoyl] N-acetylglucosamine deacetylase/3-hydroxyacyl-[acyl-carrier-protein] dehydratase